MNDDSYLEALERRTRTLERLMRVSAGAWLGLAALAVCAFTIRPSSQQTAVPQSLKVSELVVIDPKGVIGPMGYDIGVFLNNLHWWSESHHSDTNALLNAAVAGFSAAMEIPESDLRKWAYAVQVLASWWTFDEMPALYTGGVVKADIWDV